MVTNRLKRRELRCGMSLPESYVLMLYAYIVRPSLQ